MSQEKCHRSLAVLKAYSIAASSCTDPERDRLSAMTHDQDRASVYLTKFDARAHFCSLLRCEHDVQCGAGAPRLVQSSTAVSVPMSCAD